MCLICRVFWVLILGGILVGSGFCSSQVVVNSRDFRDVFTAGVYADWIDSEFFFMSSSSNVTEFLYELDFTKNLTFIEGLGIGYGNLFFDSRFNLVGSSSNSYLENLKFVANRTGCSKFFLIDSEQPYEAINLIPVFRENEVLPIFLSLENKDEVIDFLNVKVSELGDVQVFFYDDLNPDLNLGLNPLLFTISELESLGNYENSLFVLDFLNSLGRNVSTVNFVSGDFLERSFFESELPFVLIPKIGFEESFLVNLSGIGVERGIFFGDNYFDIAQNLHLDNRFDILFSLYDYRVNVNSIYEGGGFSTFGLLDVFLFENLSLSNFEVLSANFIDYDSFTFSFKNVGESVGFYQYEVKFFWDNDLIYSVVNSSDVGVDVDSIVVDGVEISSVTGKNLRVEIELKFSEQAGVFARSVFFSKEVSVPNQPSYDSGKSGSWGGFSGSGSGDVGEERVIEEELTESVDIILNNNEIFDYLEIEDSSEINYQNFSLERVGRFNRFLSASSKGERLDKLKEILIESNVSEFDSSYVLGLAKSFDNSLLYPETEVRVLGFNKGAGLKKITTLNVAVKQFIEFKSKEEWKNKILKVIVVIPKNVVVDVKEIYGNFSIVAEDPVIEFSIPLDEDIFNKDLSYILLGDFYDEVGDILTYFEIVDSDSSLKFRSGDLKANLERFSEFLVLNSGLDEDEMIEVFVEDYKFKRKVLPYLDVFKFFELMKLDDKFYDIIFTILNEKNFNVLFKSVDLEFAKLKVKMVDGEEKFFVYSGKEFSSRFVEVDQVLNVVEIFQNSVWGEGFERIFGDFRKLKSSPSVLIFNLNQSLNREKYFLEYGVEVGSDLSLNVVEAVEAMILIREKEYNLDKFEREFVYVDNYENIIFIVVGSLGLILVSGAVLVFSKKPKVHISKEFELRMKLVRKLKRENEKLKKKYEEKVAKKKKKEKKGKKSK